MQEIKFRAWFDNTMFSVKSIDFNHKIINLNAGDMVDLISVELMQYIGQKDINGKEIYEKDIVKSTDYHGNRHGYIERIGSTYFLIGIDGYSDEYLFNQSNIEVIGNVYENKELMGE